jgi:hypothetical protein
MEHLLVVSRIGPTSEEQNRAYLRGAAETYRFDLTPPWLAGAAIMLTGVAMMIAGSAVGIIATL